MQGSKNFQNVSVDLIADLLNKFPFPVYILNKDDFSIQFANDSAIENQQNILFSSMSSSIDEDVKETSRDKNSGNVRSKHILEQKARLEGVVKNKTRDVFLHSVIKEGNTNIVEIHAQPMLGANGDVTGIFVFEYDVLNPKKNNKISHLATFPMLNPDPVCEINIHGDITYFNDAALKKLIEIGAPADPKLFIPEDIIKIISDDKNNLHQFTREVKIKNHIFSEIIYVLKDADLIRLYIHDITQDVQSADEINELLLEVQKEKDMLLALINSVADEVWFLDKNKKIVLRNKATEKYFSQEFSKMRDVEEIVSSLEVMNADGERRSHDDMPSIRALKGETIINEEEIVKFPITNELRYREISSSPVKNTNGKIIGSVSIVRDITEKKISEKQIHRNEVLLNAILNATNDCVWVIGKEETIIMANRAALNLMNTELEDVVGKKTSDAMSEIYSDWKENIHYVLNSGNSVLSEGKYNHRIFNYNFYAIRNKKGEIESVACFGTDVTESRNVEQALKTNEETLQKLLMQLEFHIENTPLAVVEFDSEYRVIRWSSNAEKIFGWTAEEILGKKISDVKWVYEEDRNDVDRISEEMKNNSDTSNIHTNRNYTKDGRVILCEWYNSSLNDSNGNLISVQSLIQDITERRKIQNSLRETNNYLDSLINHANAPIIVWNKDFQITRCNRAFENLTGMKTEDVIGKKLDILFPENSKSESLQKIRNTASGEHWDSIELPILHNNGSIKIALWNSANIYDEHRKIISTIAQGQDITGRKAAEDALKDNMYLLETVLSSMNEAVLTLNKKGEVIGFNEAFAEFCRLKKSQADLGKIQEVAKKLKYFSIDGDDLPYEEWPLYKSLHGHSGSNMEFLIEREDTKERWFSNVSYSPLKDKNGNIIGAVQTMHDITHSKQAEEALLESQRKFQNLIESTSDFIWEVDSEGKYTYCSPQIEKLFGIRPEEMIGRAPYDLMPENEKQQYIDYMQEIVKEGQKFEGVVNTFIGRLSSSFIETSGVPFYDDDGDLKGYRGISRDVTERKKSELELNMLLLEKETLLKEIHHRVKNNMQIIYSLMSMQSRRTTNKYIKRALDDSKNRIKSMALIHETLYKSDNVNQISMVDYINDLIKHLSISYRKQPGIKIEVNVEPIALDMSKTISCGLIITELVSNSLKYAFLNKTSGKIYISLKNNNLHNTLHDVELIINDDGVGLPKDIEIIKVKSLGLQLVETLTKQLDGSMNVVCQDGTKFIITFPKG
jgi:PAS domain S-box-containing protein